MHQSSVKFRWGVLAAAIVAVFAMSFALFTATPALAASDDLAVGDVNLTTQADDTSDAAYFTVYVKVGDADAVVAAEYTEEEFEALATTDGDPVSGLYYKGGVWNVSTAVTYVTLEDLLSDAGVLWTTGASIGYGGDPAQGKTSNSFTYDELQKMYFYPKTTATATDTSDGVLVPMVFGLKTSNSGVAIGADETAADVQAAAAETNVDTCAPYAIVGSSEDDYKAGSGTTVAGKRLWREVTNVLITYDFDGQTMYRVYNPNSGEHFYTASTDERDMLKAAGWNDEGEAWTAPVYSGTPVYRLYSGTDHHYTTNEEECDWLIEQGWSYEGIGWYSDDEEGVALYRAFNPNVDPSAAKNNSGSHHYSANKAEIDYLVTLGWKAEGIGWYGVEAAA